MWSILDSLYGQNLACKEEPSTVEVFGQLFPIEQLLLQWRRHLPSPLSIVSSQMPPSLDGVGQKQKLSTILTLRYLNLHLLLHRPILVKFFDCQNKEMGLEDENALLQEIGTTSIVRCNESASKIISIVHSAINNPEARELLGAWWFTLYYSTISPFKRVQRARRCDCNSVLIHILPQHSMQP